MKLSISTIFSVLIGATFAVATATGASAMSSMEECSASQALSDDACARVFQPEVPTEQPTVAEDTQAQVIVLQPKAVDNPTIELLVEEHPTAPAIEETSDTVVEEPVVEPIEEVPTEVAQVPALEPVSAPRFFGTDGDSTGAQVSASVYVEPDVVVNKQQAGLTVDAVTVDVFRQGVDVSADGGHYSSEEFGGSLSVEVHRDDDVAVRVRAYGGTINETWSGDDGWSGDGHTTYGGVAVDAEVALNDNGGVVTGSVGVKHSTGESIGGDDFSRTNPTINVAVDTPVSEDGRTNLYVGLGHDEEFYGDFAVNYDVLGAENQSLALGAFASYRNGEAQVGPEIAYTIGNEDEEGLYARVAGRLNAINFEPQVAAEVGFTF